MKEIKQKHKYEYEYTSYKELEGIAKVYIRIPKSLIINKELDSKRISVYTYLHSYKGLHSKMVFSLPMYLKWANYKSDAHNGGINNKIISLMDRLNDIGYITYTDSTLTRKNKCIELEFNTNFVYEECVNQGGFAVVWLDEVEKIMNYKEFDANDTYMNCNIVLLVFSFLRCSIFRTPNRLNPEDRSEEGIERRRKKCIEAYAESYKNISQEIGISERMVSNAVKILKKLELIEFAEPYRIKNDNGEYRTPYTIFANVEKREREKLFTFDRNYAINEIERKEASIRKYSTVNYNLKPNYKQ